MTILLDVSPLPADLWPLPPNSAHCCVTHSARSPDRTEISTAEEDGTDVWEWLDNRAEKRVPFHQILL